MQEQLTTPNSMFAVSVVKVKNGNIVGCILVQGSGVILKGSKQLVSDDSSF
jgi:hypothetical protein